MRSLTTMKEIIARNAYLLKPEMRTAMEMANDDLFINDGKGVVKYYSDFAPYMSRALTIATSRAFRELIVVGSSRSAKTKTVVEAFCYWQVTSSAGDIFIYCSTASKANEIGSTDLDRCVRNTPKLNALALYSREHWKIAEKNFKTCKIKLGSATETTTSASGYKSVICTDYDRSSDDIGEEGNKFELMSGRTTNLGSAGMAIAESSPGRQVKKLAKGTHKHDHPVPAQSQGIAGLYNQGTQERFYWRCTEKECESFFIPEFSLMSFIDEGSNKERSLTACLPCPHCGMKYVNSDKYLMNVNAINHGNEGYFQEHQITDGLFNGQPYINKSRGSIWFEGTIVAAAARAWPNMVEKYLDALEQYEKFGDESALKAFNNTWLGRNYVLQDGTVEDVELSWLWERAKAQYETYPYAHGIIPKECRYLIMSVDIQNGKNARFVCQATAFTEDGLRLYVVDRFEIIQDNNGDRVNPAREVDSWKLLIERVMQKTYPVEGSYETMRAVKTVADMGGTNDKGKHVSTSTTEIAYQFVKYLESNSLKSMFELSKGSAKRNMKGFYNYSDNETSTLKDSCPYLEMNGNMLSNSIRNAITRKGESGLLIVLPYWMKGTKKSDWFNEIIAEELNADSYWYCGKGTRNEAVDLTKMALSCSFWLNDNQDEQQHRLMIGDNPYVMPDEQHIFLAPVKHVTVEFSDAALAMFGDF